MEMWARASSNIDERAKTLSARQVLLFVIAIVPLVIGFAVFWIWRALWLAVSWVWAAGIEGWELGKRLTSKGEPE
jgi:hypothetical protein